MVTFLYIDKKVEMKKMNKKIVAILMVTMMSATMFAGIATVSAEDDDFMNEVKEHVTPEQWAEIEDLINKNEQSRSLPDLNITDFDQAQDEKLWAEVWNKGDGWCKPFDVYFHIDNSGWQSIGRDIVWLGLSSGSTVWTNSNSCPLSGTFDCRAWADKDGKVSETDDGNNKAFDTFSFS